jgi:hypothetical protein
MSIAVMNLCWPLRMPPTPKAVLMCLADSASDAGECWPSLSLLSERTCFSERAIQSAIRWLEASSAIVADRTNGRHTRYAITVDTFNPRSSCTPAVPAPPQMPHPTPAAPAWDPRSSCVGPPQQVPSNPKEPSRTIKSNPRGSVVQIPDWLDADAWKDWSEYRKGRKGAWTQKAQELSIRKLDEFRRQGHTPVSVIHLAIERGWQGLYKPQPEVKQNETHRNSSRLSAVERVEQSIRERRAAEEATIVTISPGRALAPHG